MAPKPHHRRPVTPVSTADTKEIPLSSPAKPSQARPVLLSYDEIPAWHQDNDCIRHGYRPETNSARLCFNSWRYLHNETFNIFSHLVPGILFLIGQAVLNRHFERSYPNATVKDHLVFSFFLLSAAACLSMSATYHTLMNHSEGISHLWLRLDFVGIIILTLGDFVSGIYMVFYCEPVFQKVYWAMILSLGLGTAIALVSPRFQGRRWRTFRVSLFVCTGLSGFAPLAHGIKLFGFEQMVKQSGILYYLGEGGALILGALIYATRIPEVFSPGKFDILGCSHQIFHVLVVLATVIQLVGILDAFDYNYRYRQCHNT